MKKRNLLKVGIFASLLLITGSSLALSFGVIYAKKNIDTLNDEFIQGMIPYDKLTDLLASDARINAVFEKQNNKSEFNIKTFLQTLKDIVPEKLSVDFPDIVDRDQWEINCYYKMINNRSINTRFTWYNSNTKKKYFQDMNFSIEN